MRTMLKKLSPFSSSPTRNPTDTDSTAVSSNGTSAPTVSAAMRELVANLHYELVPMKSVDQAIAALPPASYVSVTCSPVKGIPLTQEYTERIANAGHNVVPHFSARMVENKEEVAALAAWVKAHELDEVFVIAGDSPEAAGPYEGALEFIREFLEHDSGVQRVGITAYPDGHALIDQSVIDEALLAKQALLAEYGVDGWASTQMCFDEEKIRSWLLGERARGFALPVRLGVPGVVDRARLMSMGTRLGIGSSLRYLSKNRSTVMKMMAPGGYDPTDIVTAFADDAEQLGIAGLHSFTFNAVAETVQWQQAIVGDTE